MVRRSLRLVGEEDEKREVEQVHFTSWKEGELPISNKDFARFAKGFWEER